MSTDKGFPVDKPALQLDADSLGLNLQALILDFMQGHSEALLASGTWNWNTEASKTLLVGAPALYQPVITKIVFVAQVAGIVAQAVAETVSVIDNDSLENIFGNWFNDGVLRIADLGSGTGKFDVEGGIVMFGPPQGGYKLCDNSWTVLTGDLVGSISALLPGNAPVYYMVFGIRSPPII